MSYIDPNMVLSPKWAVKNVRVIEDLGEHGYSVARLQYEGDDVLACRWNGSNGGNGEKSEPYGHPNSRGIPTWFVLPNTIKDDVLKGVLSRAKRNPKISYEIDNIRKDCEFMIENDNVTPINIVPLSKDITPNEANLIAEFISNDDDFKNNKICVLDFDADGCRSINPISKLNGVLHITLYRLGQ